MTLVSVQDATRQVERLMEILEEIGAKHVAQAGVQEGLISMWEILDELVNPDEAHALDDDEAMKRHIAGAGLHDLAAKICTVWDKLPAKRRAIESHLKLLAQTYYVGQNEANPRWDVIDGVPTEHGSADKVIELYWGCLCLLDDFEVELDDPVRSSQGKNPDVLATSSDKTTWAFAIKTLAQSENVSKNLLINLEKGMRQILASGADKGFVVINAKNVLNHNLLRQHAPYRNWEEADAVVAEQLDEVMEAFYRDEAAEIAHRFEVASPLAPLFVIVAHSSMLCYPPQASRPMWTELKTMRAKFLPLPHQPKCGSFGAEAWDLAKRLNDVVQTCL